MNEDYLSLGLLVALGIGGMIGLNYILTPHAKPLSPASNGTASDLGQGYSLTDLPSANPNVLVAP